MTTNHHSMFIHIFMHVYYPIYQKKNYKQLFFIFMQEDMSHRPTLFQFVSKIS